MPDIIYKGTGGLNEDADSATPDQVVRSANVWMPHGRIEMRPGFTGVGSQSRFTATMLNKWILTHDVSTGIITNTGVVGGLEEGDHVYFVLDYQYWKQQQAGLGFNCNITAYNSNPVGFYLSYWNGSAWVVVPSAECIVDGVSRLRAINYVFSDDGLATNAHFFPFPSPQDWQWHAITDAGGTTYNGYALRLTFTDKGAAVPPATLTAGTTVAGVFPMTGFNVTNQEDRKVATGMFRFDLASGRYYYFGLYDRGLTSLPGMRDHTFCVSRSPYGLASDHSTVLYATERPFVISDELLLSSLAPVPQADRAYVSVHRKILEINPNRDRQVPLSNTPGWLLEAQVEDSEAIVGPGAIADRETLAQLSSFPEGTVVVFFQNRLWVMNKHRVRWSLAAPAHKVWPSAAFADLMENDNSEIVAAAPLGEHLVIYKQDSIWIMVSQGIDDFGVAQYTPVQVVRGIGCVAPNSLQTVRARHVFLGEDGIYTFDGTPNVRKVNLGRTGDRLSQTISEINQSTRYLAAGVNWQSRSCYLLSFAHTRFNTNVKTLVWQYDRDIWWVWDGFEAQFWMSDEDNNDDEELYFGDTYGRIYKFGIGRTDYGTDPLPFVIYPYIGRDDGTRKIANDVEILTSNSSAPTDVGIAVNDGDETLSTYSNVSAAEAKYGTAVYGMAKFVGERRRYVKRDWAEAGDMFAVSAAKTADHPGKKWEINSVRVGVTPIGRR